MQLETNATGKPVIATAVGDIPSVIQDGYNRILVPPSDAKGLAATIKRAVEEEDLLRQMGKNRDRQRSWSDTRGGRPATYLLASARTTRRC